MHQEFEAERDGVKYLATPSTCLQFKTNSREFAIDPAHAPGYRCIELMADGKIKSWVVRIADFNPTYDLSARGY